MMIILGSVFFLAGGGLLAGKSFGRNMTGPFVMFLFVLGFFGLVIWSKKNWWAVMPGGIFLSGGVAAVLDILIPSSKVTGPVFLFLLAATFITIAILSKKSWWVMIPGGLFASIGLVAVFVNLFPHEDYAWLFNTIRWGFYTWVLFLGLAATFGTLWLMRATRPTGWAKYPAACLLVMAVLSFTLGSRFQEFCLATVLLVVGVILLLSIFTRKKEPENQ